MSMLSVPFMRIALGASLLTGTALALLGVFMTVRRVAFSGLAVSQLAALGAVLGVSVLGWHLGAQGVALIFVGLGMALLNRLAKIRSVPADSWVAGLYVLGASLAVLVLSKAPRGESETLTLFFGNILSLNSSELWESAGILLTTLTLLGFWFYRWVWISFDAVAAEVSGISIGKWNFIFYGLFALVMTVAIHILGVLLAFSYLMLPATAGLLACGRVKSLFFFVPAFTAFITLVGFTISFHYDFPTGPLVASLLAAGTLGMALLFPARK